MNSPNNAHLTGAGASSGTLDERVTRALEQKPEPRVPLDFAARVAASAVAQPVRRRRVTPQFGKLMMLLSGVAVSIALFALAPHAAPNVKNLSFDAEVLLLGELALIGGWVSRLYGGSTSR